MFYRKKQSGFSLIELLVAISFISVVVILTVNFTTYNKKVYQLNEEHTKAMFFAMEGLEAAKLVAWSDLLAGDHHLSLVDDLWTLETGSELLDNVFTRTLTVSDVYRDSSENNNVYGDIGGAYLDPNTKKVTVTIDWESRAKITKQEVVETYLHRWQADRWTQTDWIGGDGQANWSDETKFFTKDEGVDIDTAGIVTLRSGFIDWSYATTTAMFDTPGNFEDNDVVEINEIAYLVTKNNPSGPELYILDVSDSYNPVELSSINIGSSISSVKAQDNNYIYLSTEDNSAELQVVDVSDSYNPVVVATYDLPSNENATDLDIASTKAYISQGDTLYSFDISSSTSPQLLDDIVLDAIISRISFSENYIYTSTYNADKELQIVDVNNPINLQAVGFYNLPGSLHASYIMTLGTRVYISTDNSGSQAEFYMFDLTNPTSLELLGSYELGESIHSFHLVGPYALLGTNFLEEELVVIEITDPDNIVKIMGFDLNGYVLGMSANCSMIYAATSSNEAEFFIISTEVTDCGYTPAGTLESSTFDTGSDEVQYNWLTWEGESLEDTYIRFQLATSANINGPWNFVGPDGSSGTYYDATSTEMINYDTHLNQRYIRYKLFMGTDSELQVPVLENIVISYSAF